MSDSPSFLAVNSAIETLRAAGWTLHAPDSLSLQMMTLAEACEALRFSRGKLRGLILEGHFPRAVLVGTDVRIPRTDLEAFIARQPSARRPQHV